MRENDSGDPKRNRSGEGVAWPSWGFLLRFQMSDLQSKCHRMHVRVWDGMGSL